MISRRGVSKGDVLTALREGTPIARDDMVFSSDWNPSTQVDVRGIRERLGLSPEQFAQRYGFRPTDVYNWEGGTRPEPAAQTLLLLIADSPELVDRALRSAGFISSEPRSGT